MWKRRMVKGNDEKLCKYLSQRRQMINQTKHQLALVLAAILNRENERNVINCVGLPWIGRRSKVWQEHSSMTILSIM